MDKELNHTATDSLMGQITEAMECLNKKRDLIDNILHLYHQAQTSSLTEPADQVAIILDMVFDRLDNFSVVNGSEKSKNLAGLAREIHESEA